MRDSIGDFAGGEKPRCRSHVMHGILQSMNAYSAILTDGNRLDWRGERPPKSAVPAAVIVTLLEETPSSPKEAAASPIEYLRQIAELPISKRSGLAAVDPVAWQKEQRRDRPLPGREDE
jgi:hypothetical protein